MLNLLKTYKIYLYATLFLGTILSSGYVGYKLSDARWLTKQARVEAQYRVEQEKLLEKLSVALNDAEKLKQERKAIYREKINYIKSDAPECSITDDKLHELQCLAAPSKCRD